VFRQWGFSFVAHADGASDLGSTPVSRRACSIAGM
jgi:hypothetical protein